MTSQYGVTINRSEDATITYVAATGYAKGPGTTAVCNALMGS